MNMDPNLISRRDNQLLAALSPAQWEGRNFKPVFMPLGEVVNEPARLVDHIYFPTTAVLAVSSVMADGRANALTLIGREGLSSIEVVLGGDSASCRAVVLSAGWGYQIRREALEQECGRCSPMRTTLLRYAKSYIAQVAQTTVCNRHHSVDQQLCRWLLMILDRLPLNDLPLTHDRVAELMGVRRESVSQAARALMMAGSIRYQRGRMSVVDRRDLEARACECYGKVKREADRPLASAQSIRVPAPAVVVDRVRRLELARRQATPSCA
jgi:CRP-like cAMP-binding protein